MPKPGLYGTAFEALEDEEGPVKKRPKKVHEEVVTDEKGRRRFHGAFTGGFSAGYFNTVGSKHGWVPQTFKSSRDKRAEAQQYRPEDFMDEEDLGEFGIASRGFHVNKKYASNKTQSDLGMAVWDRPTVVSSALDDLFKVSEKQTSDSIGLKIMKRMGYREGKGIGAPLTRKQLEIQRVMEGRARGKKTRFDKSAIEEAEEFAKDFEFLPEDVPSVYFQCKENDHGLGYRPLEGLSGGYGSVPQVDERTKRGAAFGVGVYEDSDDDIYETEDMSKYNFELGKADVDPMSRRSKTSTNSDVYNTVFVKAKQGRKPPPQLSIIVPPDFRPRHVPIVFDSSKLPPIIKNYGKDMTVLQRAMILGETNLSALNMLTVEDREKLKQARRIVEEKKPKEEIQKSYKVHDPFIEKDEEKSYRFQKYLQCLKRGVPCGKPSGMPIEQWQVEEQEFQNAVPQELRYLLPDIKERKEPLYKGDFGQSLMNKFKSKFVSTEETVTNTVKETKSIEPFVKLEWHPAKRLCKRLNVPDPFPFSDLEGIPGVEPKVKQKKEFTTTELENEVVMRGPKRMPEEKEEKKIKVEETPEPEPLFKFFELMNEVFGTTEEEIKEGEKLEEIVEKEKVKEKEKERMEEKEKEKERMKVKEKEKVPEAKSRESEKKAEFRSFFDFAEDEEKSKNEKNKNQQKLKIEKETSESEESSGSTEKDHKKDHRSHRREHKKNKKDKKDKDRSKDKDRDSKKKKKKKRRKSDSDSSVVDVY
ncbi:hypothetical protein FO519_004289 [Halicephalobus sp. NKZ332]|nr:hypothetical protein FO519_004289 [Halicephalobus sp. NKZ332]